VDQQAGADDDEAEDGEKEHDPQDVGDRLVRLAPIALGVQGAAADGAHHRGGDQGEDDADGTTVVHVTLLRRYGCEVTMRGDASRRHGSGRHVSNGTR